MHSLNDPDERTEPFFPLPRAHPPKRRSTVQPAIAAAPDSSPVVADTPSPELPFAPPSSHQAPPSWWATHRSTVERPDDDDPTRQTTEAALPDLDNPDSWPPWLEGPTEPPSEREDEADLEVEEPPRAMRERLDLETYAAVLCACHVHPHERGRILEDERISADLWRRGAMRWERAIGGAVRRGDDTLLRQFDRAYLRRLEAERGHDVGAETYASLEVAAEHARLERQLAKERIPAASMMIIRRHWIRRLVDDEAARRRVNEHMGHAREGAACSW